LSPHQPVSSRGEQDSSQGPSLPRAASALTFDQSEQSSVLNAALTKVRLGTTESEGSAPPPLGGSRDGASVLCIAPFPSYALGHMGPHGSVWLPCCNHRKPGGKVVWGEALSGKDYKGCPSGFWPTLVPISIYDIFKHTGMLPWR
jgi:hypothetical protein